MRRTKKNASPKRKSAVRKNSTSPKAAGASRAQGIKLYALAGRPTKEQFQLVYGERGHLMTWKERAKAGVSAKEFQRALAAKQSGR